MLASRASSADLRRKKVVEEKCQDVWQQKQRAQGFRLMDAYDYEQGISLWAPSEEDNPVKKCTAFLKHCVDTGAALRPPTTVLRYEYGNASTRGKSRLTQILDRKPKSTFGVIDPNCEPHPPTYSPFGWRDPYPNPQAEPLDYELSEAPPKKPGFFYTYGRGIGPHLQEPILRAPQPLAYRKTPATYYDKPEGLVSQYHIDGVPNKSWYPKRPHTSSGVRSTNAHSARSKYINKELARTSAFIRNPHAIDQRHYKRRHKIVESEDKIHPGWNDWMFAESYTEPQQHAMAILLAIRRRASKMKQRVRDIFAIYCDRRDGKVNGVLPLEHFLYALQEKRIIPWQTLTLEHLARACREFDPEFKGHVCLEHVRRVIVRLPQDAFERLRNSVSSSKSTTASESDEAHLHIQLDEGGGSSPEDLFNVENLHAGGTNLATSKSTTGLLTGATSNAATSSTSRLPFANRRTRSAPRLQTWRDFVLEEPKSPTAGVGSPKNASLSPRMDRSALDPVEIEAMRLLHGAPLLPPGKYLKATDSYHVADRPGGGG
ncbi:unnamed protein product [Amoebophrya sp. A120]|nr:unnamed protein product [Amoebophrya sp. A120]|eukprot:GSA120T00003657001.1